MKHGAILQILIALVVSIGGAYAMNSVQVARVDERQQQFMGEAERAIERVKYDTEARIDREAEAVSDKLEKIDQNVQWLIKQQVETRALINRKLNDNNEPAEQRQ